MVRFQCIAFLDLWPDRQELNKISTLLTDHYQGNFHSLQNDKSGLRPIEPSSCFPMPPDPSYQDQALTLDLRCPCLNGGHN